MPKLHHSTRRTQKSLPVNRKAMLFQLSKLTCSKYLHSAIAQNTSCTCSGAFKNHGTPWEIHHVWWELGSKSSFCFEAWFHPLIPEIYEIVAICKRFNLHTAVWAKCRVWLPFAYMAIVFSLQWLVAIKQNMASTNPNWEVTAKWKFYTLLSY